jgi:subtilisin family serine protease
MRRGLTAAAVLLVLLTAAAPAGAAPGPPTAPQYWFDNWRVPSLWAAGARGQGVTIAEIDTGVNADLPELRGRVLPGKDFGTGGDGRVDREVDAFGHGTAMASIMIARPGLLDITGLAPDAQILPIAVPLRGTTDSSLPDRLPEAIRYAADRHAKIISMSLGGKRSPKFDRQPCTDDEQAAIFYALRKGSLVIASVGNTGPRRNAVEDPAVCLGVVSVGAVDESGAVASFSTRQPYVTLVAPGVGVPSLGRLPGQAYSGDGTSQATAIASAVAALVWSKHPRLTAEQVVTRLIRTLADRRRQPSPAYGFGVLDAYRAVTARVPAGAGNPVYEAVAPFLARDDALRRARQQEPPPRAAPRVRSTGSYVVGSAPRVTGKVVTGLVLAGGGLALLLALLAGGLRSRRRRLVAAVAQWSYPGWAPPPGDPAGGEPGDPAGGDDPAGGEPGDPAGGDDPARSRPLPRPRASDDEGG